MKAKVRIRRQQRDIERREETPYMGRGDKIGIIGGSIGLLATIVAMVAIVASRAQLNGSHFWTSYVFFNVFSLLALFTFSVVIGVSLRHGLKRRHITKASTSWAKENFNTSISFLLVALWIPIFVSWLFFVSETSYLPDQRASPLAQDSYFYLILWVLPTTGLALVSLCYLIEELFNPTNSP
ncbi:MAG: hypothetical protein WAN86_22935 [Hyphomicrobiaceae bacterium]